MSTLERKKDPFIRISKRSEGMSAGKAWGIRVIGLILALLVSAIVIFVIVRIVNG